MPLPDDSRAVLRISGPEALPFLQGLLTQDVARLADTPLLFTALLSPQGKVLYDGFLSPSGEGILLDIPASQAEALAALLMRYRLRAKVEIAPTDLQPILGEGAPDPRHPGLPARRYTPSAAAASNDWAAYHAQRIALAIPEAAHDLDGELTALDAGYDLLHAISFTKGCYVGQEITARMHYRHIRRRVPVTVVARAPIATSGPILQGDQVIGTLRAFLGNEGIALCKTEMLESTEESTLHGVPVTLRRAGWLLESLMLG